MFGIVDMDSFYANAERLFRPDLKDRPIVVLSNNDGCVVARSKEAKALGIKMAAPYFQIRDLLQRHGAAVFSSNYAYYSQISGRVMSTLESLAPAVEVYSIDEAFVDMSNMEHVFDLGEFGMKLRKTVYRNTGLTACVGIAQTKTLAKLANRAAKKYSATNGVVDLSDKARQRRLMALTPVGEVWGVGRRLSTQLKLMGIRTALDLADAQPQVIRKEASVMLERTVRELNGISCFTFESEPTPKQQIVCSRTFSRYIESQRELKESIVTYAERAAEKLRGEGQHCRMINVFIRTNGFNSNHRQYSNSAGVQLHTPTNDSRDIIESAVELLNRIYREGYRYKKAGVMLSDFYAPGVFQKDLFCDNRVRPGSEKLMGVIDKINQEGLGRVFYAGQGIQQEWAMQRKMLSPRYTTQWSEIPEVN